MGSKSSSSTQKTEYVSNTNENISGLDDSYVASDGSDININALDGGAISDAFNFGGEALDFGAFGLDRVLDYGQDIAEDQADQLTNTLASINAANATGATLTSANQQETIRTVVKYGAIAVGLIGVVWAFRKVTK